jgi:hydrogenase maturation protease
VLILDAVKTRREPPGHVGTYGVDDLEDSIHADSPHHTNFATAIELGNRVHGDRMPGRILVIGVEVDNIVDFSEELTPDVMSSVPRATETALGILRDWGVPVSDGD